MPMSPLVRPYDENAGPTIPMVSSRRPRGGGGAYPAPRRRYAAGPAGGDGGADEGGGPAPTAAAAPGLPAAPRPPSNFRKSLDLQRANEANSAAVFAANAPAPRVSAWGDAQTGAAARQAYVARQATTANAQDFGQGQGYFRGQEVEDRDFGLNQALTGAQVGLAGSEAQVNVSKAGANDAYSRYVPRSVARQNEANAALDSSRAQQVTATTPALVDQGRAEARYKGAQAEQVAAGGDLTKGQLATATKQLTAAQQRIRHLESQLNRRMSYDESDAAGGSTATPAAAGTPRPPTPTSQPTAAAAATTGYSRPAPTTQPVAAATSGYLRPRPSPQPSPGPSGAANGLAPLPPQPSTPEEAAALPPGTRFLDPMGNWRVR